MNCADYDSRYAVGRPITPRHDAAEVEKHERYTTYDQCGATMLTLERIVLGPVCGDCCRKNHRRVLGNR